MEEYDDMIRKYQIQISEHTKIINEYKEKIEKLSKKK
jgi:hypothetical protein